MDTLQVDINTDMGCRCGITTLYTTNIYIYIYIYIFCILYVHPSLYRDALHTVYSFKFVLLTYLPLHKQTRNTPHPPDPKDPACSWQLLPRPGEAGRQGAWSFCFFFFLVRVSFVCTCVSKYIYTHICIYICMSVCLSVCLFAGGFDSGCLGLSCRKKFNIHSQDIINYMGC